MASSTSTKPTKILLLGANGQLGSDIVTLFAKSFSHYTITSLFKHQLDIINLETISQVLLAIDFDILINCTSFHKTDEVETNADKAFVINAKAVKIIAETCHKKNAKFIHISTDYVFSGMAEKPYTEECNTGPVNVYGASKLMGESLIPIFCNNFLILRVASLFGIAGASGKGGNFIETMIKFGKEKGVLKVINEGAMSPTSTRFIATTIGKMLNLNAPSGVYHIVNDGAASWYDFAKEIIKLSKVNAEVLPIDASAFPTPALRPKYSVLDNSKIKKLGITTIPWQESLAEYLHLKGYL